MRRLLLTAILILISTTVSAQAPTSKSALEKAREAEQRALVLVQATDAYKAWKAISEARQQLEAMVKADDAKKVEK